MTDATTTRAPEAAEAAADGTPVDGSVGRDEELGGLAAITGTIPVVTTERPWRPQWRKMGLVLAAAVAIPVVTVGGTVWWLQETVDDVVAERVATTPEQAADFAHLRLPAAAADVQAVRYAGLRDYVYLRFTLPTNQLPEFLDAAEVTEPLSGGLGGIDPATGAEVGWDLGGLDAVESVQDGGEELPLRAFVVDRVDGGNCVVYVHAHQG